MQDVGKGGRTVLFVSHNLAAVTRICPRAIMLDAGGVARDGPASEVVGAYLAADRGTAAAREWLDISAAPGGDICRLRAARVRTRRAIVTDAVDIRAEIGIEIEFDVLQAGCYLLPHFYLWNEEGIPILVSNDLDPEWRRRRRPAGRYVSTGWIPGNFLAEGTVLVDVAVVCLDPNIAEVVERSVIGFQVIDNMEGDSSRGDWAGPMSGVVRPMLEWTTQHHPENTVRTVTA